MLSSLQIATTRVANQEGHNHMADTSLHSFWERYVPDDADAVAARVTYGDKIDGGSIFSLGNVIEIAPNGPTYTGSLDGAEGLGDVVAVELVAGQTYTWSHRGTAEGGIEDPYLILFDASGAYVTEDDDGGFGRTSQLTFTATVSGTHYLVAGSWYQIAGQDYVDVGDYEITQWSPDPALDAPASFDTSFNLDLGANYAYIDVAGDVDVYTIDVEAGLVYSFAYAGGFAGGSDYDGNPANIAYLDLYDAEGNLIGSNLNYESSLSYFASENETLYVVVDPYFGTGGYTIDVTELNPADYDPLESLNWDRAANIPTVDVDGVPTATVYFAPAGENFGETESNGDPMATFGWTQEQQDAVMHALQTQYTPITGINYVITDNAEEATFRMLTTSNTVYGARFYPQDPAYGTQMGIGTFNLRSGGFGTDNASLLPGGYSYAVILHEFGHAHGVAHPHDTGGGSDIMLGVTASTGSLGVYDLNQGVYTVMSYNDGWETHPDGILPYSAATRGSGWSETLGAFDIAVLQARYGVHEANTGDDVYVIQSEQAEASYMTIWDTGGTDEIRYDGDTDARIDLMAATLDYTPTGGGVVSFAHGVFGGFTIANGVVIENATGGSGNDVLIGNDAANILTGNDGNDLLMGRDGDDLLMGGDGDDTFVLNAGNSGTDTIMDFVTADTIELGGMAGNNVTFDDDGVDAVISVNGGDIAIVEGAMASAALSATDFDGTQGNVYLYGIKAVFGTDGGDTMVGSNARSNVLLGGDGDDIVLGKKFDDYLIGNDGDDTLKGQNGNDELFGGDGDDELLGQNGDDYLSGDNGDDIINGGNGSDFLAGGAGADVFVFDSFGSNSGVDTVSDFDLLEDSIVVDSSAAVTFSDGADGAEMFVGGSLAAIFAGVSAADLDDDYGTAVALAPLMESVSTANGAELILF